MRGSPNLPCCVLQRLFTINPKVELYLKDAEEIEATTAGLHSSYAVRQLQDVISGARELQSTTTTARELQSTTTTVRNKPWMKKGSRHTW